MIGAAVMLVALACFGVKDAWQAMDAADMAVIETQKYTKAEQQAEQNAQSARMRRVQIEGFAVSLDNQQKMIQQLDSIIDSTKRNVEARAREVRELKEKQTKLRERKEELENAH